jgi:hypothetical protein
MSTTQPTGTNEPIPWAGVATWPADMDNREILCFGKRLGRDLTIEKAYQLRGWKPQSLVDSLLKGLGDTPAIEEVQDLTGLVPVASFDLPKGAGIGQALLAFQRVARGFGTVLERAASAQVAFHLSPRLLELLWRELGAGGPVWIRSVFSVLGERDMVGDGEAWRKGVRVAFTAALEEKNGPRHQLTGHRVLDADLGVCPECGSPMVKVDGRAVCELEAIKMEVLPPGEDITQNPALIAALQAELGGVTEMAGDLWPDHGAMWDETV